MANLTTLSTAYLRFNDILTTPSTDLYFRELMVADGKICYVIEMHPTKTINNIEKHNILSFVYVTGSSITREITVYTQEDGWIYDNFKNFRVVQYLEPSPTSTEFIEEYQAFLDWINQNVTVIEQTGEIQKIKFSSSQPFTLSTPNGEPTWSWISSASAASNYGQVYMIANDLSWDGTTVVSSELKDGIYVITLYCQVDGGIYTNYGGIAINTKLQGLVLTGNNIKVEGNISSLILSPYSKIDRVNLESFLSYVNYSLDGINSNMFQNLFANNTSITDVSDLICDVIANTTAYAFVFQNCSNLLNLPQLPVKSLMGADYGGMFSGCTSLMIIPNNLLPSITLSNQCYYRMFEGCTSLKIIPNNLLPATTLSGKCYQRMFEGCTSLTTLPELPAMTLPSACYSRMFDKCSNIKLSETQIDNYTKEYRIPSSGTGTESSSLSNMFRDTGGTFTGTPTINTTYYLWVEPQSNKTYIGIKSLVSSHIGTKEVQKIYLNGVTLYEKEQSQWGGTDLTGTSWEIKDNITANAGYGQFDINFYDSNQDYNSLYIGYSIGAHATFVTMSGSVVDSNWNTFATDGEWIYPTTISITGGADATNSNLISWLEANATLISW